MEIVIILGLILLNGVLSMSEIALVSARKSRLETDAKKGSKAAGTALKLANSPDIFLATIQIGITLVGILTGLYSGDVLAQRFAPVIAKIGPLQPYSVVISQTLIVVVVTYLTLIIGELVPKRIGMTAKSVEAGRPADVPFLPHRTPVRLVAVVQHERRYAHDRTRQSRGEQGD